MISLESRLVGARRHVSALDEAIRTTQFIRNSTPQETVVCKPARSTKNSTPRERVEFQVSKAHPGERKDVMAMTTDEHNTPALDAAHLAALRARLEAERERLRGILQGLDAEVRDAEPPDEPEDYGEMGRDLTDEGTARALATDQERLLAQVEHALQRMDEGTYGLSEVSGRPIPLERLEALPWATTTVDDPAQP